MKRARRTREPGNCVADLAMCDENVREIYKKMTSSTVAHASRLFFSLFLRLFLLSLICPHSSFLGTEKGYEKLDLCLLGRHNRLFVCSLPDYHLPIFASQVFLFFCIFLPKMGAHLFSNSFQGKQTASPRKRNKSDSLCQLARQSSSYRSITNILLLPSPRPKITAHFFFKQAKANKQPHPASTTNRTRYPVASLAPILLDK